MYRVIRYIVYIHIATHFYSTILPGTQENTCKIDTRSCLTNTCNTTPPQAYACTPDKQKTYNTRKPSLTSFATNRTTLINIPNATATTCWLDASLQLILTIPQLHAFEKQYNLTYNLYPAYTTFKQFYWNPDADKEQLLSCALNDFAKQLANMIHRSRRYVKINIDGYNTALVPTITNLLWGHEETTVIGTTLDNQNPIKAYNPFYGIFTTRVKCSACNNEASNQKDLRITLYSDLVLMIKDQNSITRQLLQGWDCESCKAKNSIYLEKYISKAPDIFIVENQPTSNEKNKRIVMNDRFELTIKIKTYSDDPEKSAASTTEYSLHGFVVFQGNVLDENAIGHYVAYVRNTNNAQGEFFECDGLADPYKIPKAIDKDTIQKLLQTENPNQLMKQCALYIKNTFTEIKLVEKKASEKTESPTTDLVATALDTLQKQLTILCIMAG